MATKTPRIQVTLSPEAYRIVDRMAELQRSSRSSIISELVNDLSPVLGTLLETLEAAARVRQENVQGVRDASMQELERLEPMIEEAQESLALLDLMIRNAAEPGPPTSNTGVTTQLTHSKQTKHDSRKRGAK